MLKHKTLAHLIVAWLLFAVVAIASAADGEQAAPNAPAMPTLHWQQGSVSLPGGQARLNVTDDFRYLGPEDAEKVLVDVWGNPPGNETLGMLFPKSIEPWDTNAWGVVLTYSDEGHVDDDDADSINYDELLKQMRDEATVANEERKKQGYPAVELVGWARKPFYDKSEHKLHWAKLLRFDESADKSLNYNIRVLGREGVLVLNAVAAESQLEAVSHDMPSVMHMVDFNDGYRYADYKPGVDKLAGYGLAALVAGGVASKVGLLAKLGAMLLAFKKVIVLGVAAMASVASKFFKRNK